MNQRTQSTRPQDVPVRGRRGPGVEAPLLVEVVGGGMLDGNRYLLNTWVSVHGTAILRQSLEAAYFRAEQARQSDQGPDLSELLGQALELYLAIAVRSREITPGEFHTLSSLISSLQTDDDRLVLTPRQVNDVANLRRKGWISTPGSVHDWITTHVKSVIDRWEPE